MQEHLPYISLDSCINDYLVESEQSVSKYYKCWQLAFRGFEDLGIDFFYQIKAIKLPIEDNMTVRLPADYLNWTKVGVLNDRGEIIPLYYNDKLSTYSDLQNARISKTDDTNILAGDWGLGTWWNFWNGYAYTNIYGLPSGQPFVGSFKIDTANGILLLNDQFRYSYLMLEYMSSPVQEEAYYLPQQFREALIAWLYWKDNKAKSIRSHMELGLSRDYKSDYYRERRNAIARWKPIRIYEMYQASQEMTRLSIKT